MWRGLQNLQVPTTEVKTNFGEREAFACPDGVCYGVCTPPGGRPGHSAHAVVVFGPAP